MKSISAIVAYSQNRVIGKDGGIPWHFPNDLKSFKELTLNNVVIMGRKTYESLPEKVRPLPNRFNIILTRNSTYHEDSSSVAVCDSVEKALMIANMKSKGDEIFVIGGEEVYRKFFPMLNTIYATVIHKIVEGDTFFPKLDSPGWCYHWGDSFYRNNKFRTGVDVDNFDFQTLRRYTPAKGLHH